MNGARLTGRQIRASEKLVFLCDAANLLTFAGLLCGVLGLFLIAGGRTAEGLVFLLAGVAFDTVDGPVARRTARRPKSFLEFGVQLDSFADMVCCGVGPALLVIVLGDLSGHALVPAMMIVCACALRLASFNLSGLSKQGSFSGLPVFYNPILIGAVYMLSPLLGNGSFYWSVFTTVIVLSLLNVSSVPVPKHSGAGTLLLLVVTLGLMAGVLLTATA